MKIADKCGAILDSTKMTEYEVTEKYHIIDDEDMRFIAVGSSLVTLGFRIILTNKGWVVAPHIPQTPTRKIPTINNSVHKDTSV